MKPQVPKKGQVWQISSEKSIWLIDSVDKKRNIVNIIYLGTYKIGNVEEFSCTIGDSQPYDLKFFMRQSPKDVTYWTRKLKWESKLLESLYL